MRLSTISRKSEFDEFRKLNKRLEQGFLRMFFLRKPDKDTASFGFRVPKKVGKAVKRNRVRRILREMARVQISTIPAGYNYLVTISPAVGKVPENELSQVLRNDFGALLARATQIIERGQPTP